MKFYTENQNFQSLFTQCEKFVQIKNPLQHSAAVISTCAYPEHEYAQINIMLIVTKSAKFLPSCFCATSIF